MYLHVKSKVTVNLGFQVIRNSLEIRLSEEVGFKIRTDARHMLGFMYSGNKWESFEAKTNICCEHSELRMSLPWSEQLLEIRLTTQCVALHY